MKWSNGGGTSGSRRGSEARRGDRSARSAADGDRRGQRAELIALPVCLIYGTILRHQSGHWLVLRAVLEEIIVVVEPRATPAAPGALERR